MLLHAARVTQQQRAVVDKGIGTTICGRIVTGVQSRQVLIWDIFA